MCCRVDTEPSHLVDLNRMNSLKEAENKSYTDSEKLKEVDEAKNTFKKYQWPQLMLPENQLRRHR